jgi:hypothetical protein
MYYVIENELFSSLMIGRAYRYKHQLYVSDFSAYSKLVPSMDDPLYFFKEIDILK